MGRSCKGICHLMAAESVPNKIRYEIGHRRCTLCAIFFSSGDVRCPCCRAVLRTKPRGKKS